MKPVMSRKPNRKANQKRREPKSEKVKKKTKSAPVNTDPSQIKPYEKYININESAYYIIFELGSLLGFDFLMLQVVKAWKSYNDFRNKPHSNVFTVGPSVAKVVKCKCGGVPNCKWCCGSGWLTRHVAKVKEIVEDQNIIV